MLWFGLLVSVANSQPAGYLGKTFSVCLDYGAMFDLSRLTGFDDFNPYINQQFGLTIGKVVTKSRGVVLHYRYQVSNHDLHEFNIEDDLAEARRSNPAIDESDFSLALNPPSFAGQTRMHKIGYGVQIFDKGFIAPLGNYSEFEFGIIHVSTFFFSKNEGIITPPDPYVGYLPYINFHRGEQVVYGNRRFLKLGIQFHINLAGWGRFFTERSYAFGSLPLEEYSNDKILKAPGINRASGSSFFLLKIGYGWIM